PVTVGIHPLDAPVFDMVEDVTVRDVFGGIRVYWKNRHEDEVVLTVLTTSKEYSIGECTEADRFYAGGVEGSDKGRGFNPEERIFGLYFRDRWDNLSDTLYVSATPMFEEQLDKSKFTRWNPPGIPYNAYQAGESAIENLWNGTIAPGTGGYASYTHDNTFN